MKKILRTLKHYFVPHRGNAFRPHALRHRALSLYSTILIISQLCFGMTMLASPTITSADAQTIAANVITRTNESRRANGLSGLTENEALQRAAQDKLADMFAKNYWDHTGPSGETAWQFIDGEDYRYLLAGENLAKGYDNSTEAVEAWMKSPTHRANILNNRFSEIGVAVGSGKINDQNTTLIVQLFGQPTVATVNAAPQTTVLGTSRLVPEISLSNASVPSKVPYIALWTFLLGLVVMDGIMIRRLGLHGSRSHVFNFRVALLMVALGIGALMVGVVGIA